ncbi:MAG: lipopolysaccharide biosynthesis protein [Pseudomonadota bacterium]
MSANSSPSVADTNDDSTIPSSQGDDSGFASRVRNAVAWRYGGQVAAQIITWSSTILVVRLLDPSDYGLFAMSQVLITALAFMNGQSFAASLVRAAKVGEREVAQVFGLLLTLNVALATAVFFLAPYSAAYFGEPQVAELLRIQMVLFLIVPFMALPEAMLARKLQFRPQALASMSGAVSGATVALTLAYLGYGVWALVYAPIVQFAVRALVVSFAAKVITVPNFNPRGARAIITFGGTLTLCQLFWIIQSQSDIIIAGRQFEPYELGLYSEALFVALIVTGRFLPPINEVSFPAYSELHNKGMALAPYFARVQQTVALVVAPIYIGLSLTAHEAVSTLFGPKWIEMAPLLANLAMVMPVFAVQIVCAPSTNAMGKAWIYLTTSICGAVAFASCFAFGVSYGSEGLTYAWWIAAPTLLIITMALTLPALRLTIFDLFKAWLPAIVSTALMGMAVYFVLKAMPEWAPWWKLAAIIPVGALVYASALWVIWPQVVRDSWEMLRQKKKPEAPAQPVNDLPTAQI